MKNVTESRNERLERDYREMLRIQDRPYLSWIATGGEPPCAEEYLLDVRLRSYVLTAQAGRYLVGSARRWVVRVTLWDSYPHMAPYIRMLSIPPVFHPCWYSKGTYCPPEPWSPESSLKNYILRMIGTLQYDPALIDATAPANYKALEWYQKNRDNADLFPSDATALTENSPAELAAIENSAAPFDTIIDSWGR